MPRLAADNKPEAASIARDCAAPEMVYLEEANGASVDMAQALDIAVLACAALSGLALMARAARKPAMMIITTQPRGRRRPPAS